MATESLLRSLRRPAVLLLALAALIVTTGAGCSPPARPVPGLIDLWGDSVMRSADTALGSGFTAGRPAGSTANVFALGGTSFDDWQPFMTARATDPKAAAAIHVVELGTNRPTGSFGPYTQEDRKLLFQFVSTPHVDACVVLVLPGYGTSAATGWKQSVDSARSALKDAAALRRADGHPTVTVDWQAKINADPTLVGADGIHLRGDPPPYAQTADPAAAKVFASMIWSGVAQCR